MIAIQHKAFELYSKAYKAAQFYCFNIALAFGMQSAVAKLKEAEEAAMAENLELLISNINHCKYAFELEACKDRYKVLSLVYPEFAPLYGRIVTDAINRRDELIKLSFTH